MSTKYFKIQSSQTDKTFDSDVAFKEDHNVEGDGSEEATFITTLQQMITDKKVTVTEQYFKTNATYHKIEFSSDSDDTQIQTLLDGISSFDKIQVSVIDADTYTTNKTDSELSETFKQYEQATIDFKNK